MVRRRDRGGTKTRAHIAAVATELFLEHGFDEVTIAEVADAAGVSKVTVFSHFQHKEDLMLDRFPDIVDLIRRAVHQRTNDVGVVDAFRQIAVDLAEQEHVLSGLTGDIEPFMRTVTNSPALVSRLQAFQFEIEAELAAALRDDDRFTGDSALIAALLVAAYRTVAVKTVRRRLAGHDIADIAAAHREQLETAFDVLTTGVPAASSPLSAIPEAREGRVAPYRT
ncbi:TetR/AcrR family transcriptional regulator [Mycolicibacterium komossense]|uniref:TetR family transcriptional regulator n=1 Tax=Mycolicibacterium komossense TaxID=1779 RepID=A0ABT3CAW4_9MYCO|nr:TetR/AcrR family transcriptional regulator [Mycolicibacterium komossense]MCV7226620.1 TetR family transcriptional regulator [Mycolicibacterium komossense]